MTNAGRAEGTGGGHVDEGRTREGIAGTLVPIPRTGASAFDTVHQLIGTDMPLRY
jgi:hypothetical protein